jgi:hypothetical protein
MKSTLLLLAALLAASALPARAGEGHSHDAPATAAAPALPRFAAASELFELVGVLDGRQLTLYLDHAASNAPVSGATLELELGGSKLKAVPKAEGEFAVQLDSAPQPGLIPVTATVVAGSETDLLAGELDLHGDEHAEAAASGGSRWKLIGGAALALVGLGAALRFGMNRRTAA